MRDIALTLFVFGMLPIILLRPHWGVLLWTWIGLMNPHRLSWGFAHDFEFAAVVGVVTIIAVLMSRERKRLPLTPPVIVLAALILWMTVSTIFSFYPDEAWIQWEKIIKIQVFIFLTLLVMQQRERIIALVWVSTLSVAFFGIKGGIYTLTSGGSGMVLGPDGTFIAGNTEISLALTMTIPLMRWLQLQAPQRWMRWALGLAMALTAIAVVGSYSRGGLLAIFGMGAVLWFKSRKKLLFTIVLIALIPAVLVSMPEKWFERMSTIQTYEYDSSAMGRINAWEFAYNLAKAHPFTGGGFRVFQENAFERFAPNATDVHDAHSIWFQFLGEHGFVGLSLFLLLWAFTWRTGSSIIRASRGRDDLQWAGDLAGMVQVCLVGYWIGGSFLGLGYWDYPYILMVILVLTSVVSRKELQRKPLPAALASIEIARLTHGQESRKSRAAG